MRLIRLKSLNDFAEWRAAARSLLLGGVGPEDVTWADPATPGDLFAAEDEHPAVTHRAVGTVPPRFVVLAEAAICNSDPDRFALLYRLLWRLLKDKVLLEARSDPDVGKLERRASAVRRDVHKMKTDIRFTAVDGEDGRERQVAWFEPEHYVLERTVPHFVQRFDEEEWSIVTPYRSVVWDGRGLTFGPGGSRADVPAEHAEEAWRNFPDARSIPLVVRTEREDEMIERTGIEPPVRIARHVERREREPEELEEIKSLADARAAVQGCTRCPLYEFATQAVFGEGAAHAEVMFVGEQPGDQEDLKGKPFVGPAGQVLDRAMKKVGWDRREVYVTNAVKHFKFVPRGKRRIHQRPDAGEIQACRFWLNLEREFIKPKLIVAMGATAIRGVLGKVATISSLRGHPVELEDGTLVLATVHPSYLLRMPDRDAAAVELERFEDDLKLASKLAQRTKRPH